MAIVYRAQDTITRRFVALKYLPKEEATEEYVGRFQREAKLLAKLNHDNIVKVYDVVQQKGCLCFAMELIEGSSLESFHYQTSRQTGSGIPEEEARPILVDIARALAAAHVKNILHRDIKPANIMIESETKRTVLLDFGLARGAGTQTLTKTGAVMGTLMYLAPEQIRGKKVSKATDVYQWGMVAYHLLSDHLPFEDEDDVTMAVLRTTKRLPHIWEFNDKVSEELATIIMRCIERDPSARYSDCEELYKLLAPEDFEEDMVSWTCDDDEELAPLEDETTGPVATAALGATVQGATSKAAITQDAQATIPMATAKETAQTAAGSKLPAMVVGAVVVIVLTLFGLLPGGQLSWPPDDIRVTPRSLSAKVTFATNVALPSFFYRIKATGKDGGKPKMWDKSHLYSAAEGAKQKHELTLNDLEPGRHYIIELLPKRESKVPPSATEFRTKVLQPSTTKIKLVPRGRRVALLFKTPTKARIRVLSCQRGKEPKEECVEAKEASEHELVFAADAFYHPVKLSYVIGETEWVGPELARHRLLETALADLKEQLRQPFINDGQGLRPYLPKPEELHAELLNLYLRCKKDDKALARIIQKWWHAANKEFQRVRVLVPLYVGYQRIERKKRNGLGAACACLQYIKVFCRLKKYPVNFPRAEIMPANLRAFSGEPQGFDRLPKMRFGRGKVRIYRPGPKFKFKGQTFLQELKISPSHIPPKFIEDYATFAIVLEAQKIDRDFYPVVEVNGMPLYFLSRPKRSEDLVLSHTIPSSFIIPDDGNEFKIRLCPKGQKNERMNMRFIRLIGGNKR